MKKLLAVLTAFGLSCFATAASAEDALIAGAYYDSGDSDVTYCRSLEDTKRLAELSATDTVQADTFLGIKNREALCTVKPAAFSIIREAAVYHGANGTVRVVEVEAANGHHYIITGKEVRFCLIAGARYESEAYYCHFQKDADQLAESLVDNTGTDEADTLLNSKRDAGLCNASTITFAVVGEVSVHTGKKTVRIVKVFSADNDFHYVLTSLETIDSALPGAMPVSHDVSGIPEDLQNVP
ncbi:MAG: hypothetical protein A3E38_00835 [Candidatus Moranbacteria bacterium RIFCSPHIGHO2_12_FULL_54_9]|nr:MAG: hypothetical protein A2878_03245 [Candidatus Moranbacteria bacterium RIFCSPHIGHO2_01_FULL_54_31]OGI26097.1 MAG: hypothetical protein A3E38_00835 [Candidatus Moranbacteria bacterium RIFCSPHIGHO2_12_FULL_54_9]